MNPLSHYLTQIQNINPKNKEYTYRPHLYNFLVSLKDSLARNHKDFQYLHIQHEPNNDKEGKGAPDFLIQIQGLTIGYIENKRVGEDLDSIAQSPQIAKYLQLSDNLMLTNYLKFTLLRKNDKDKTKIVQEVKICDLWELKSLVNRGGGGNIRVFRIKNQRINRTL